jgi:superfamily II DNA or RNA helicase
VRIVFDRGTLLLLEPPGGFDGLGAIPDVVFDQRVGQWRAPAYRYLDVHRALVDRGESIVDEVPSSWPRPAGWNDIELRPYQNDALEAWQRSGRRGTICLPTGSGKTRVALAAMARARQRTLCLAPTRALVEQWRREIARYHRGPVGWFGDGEAVERPITVATFESAARNMVRLGGRFDFLVVDEAHHVGGLARSETLEMAVARIRLGLTATPAREASARADLDRVVGPVVFELGLGDLADCASEAVTPFDRVTIAVDLTPEERRAYAAEKERFVPFFAELRRGMPGAAWSDLTRAAVVTPEGRAALEAWRRARRTVALTAAKAAALAELLERHRDARTLIFTADNQTACAIARRHLIMPITCDIARREREAALARFRAGDLRALVSTRALNEGVDVPAADVAILVGASGGEREYVQRIGRVLRPAAGKLAIVYEIVARGTLEMGQARRRRDGFAARAAGPL